MIINKMKLYRFSIMLGMGLAVVSCKAPMALNMPDSKVVPESFGTSKDSSNSSNLSWNDYFKDPNLMSLITLLCKTIRNC